MDERNRAEPRERPGRGDREGARVVTLAVSAIAIFLAGSLWLALFPPVPVDLGGVPNLDHRAERVTVPVGEDHVHAWVIHGKGHGVVVILHGYGRDHHRAWRYAQFLSPAGYTIVAPDFRSSAEVGRRPTTLGRYELEDAEAVLAWVAARPEFRHQPLGVLGESLGGSVALVTAARHPEVRAVVADCPFASGRRALEDTFHHWTLLPGEPAAAFASAVGGAFTGNDPTTLDVVAAADSLRETPLFLIHAANDDRMSPQQAEAIRAAAGGKDELWLTPEGHTEAWRFHPAEYERRVLAFYGRTLRGPEGSFASAAGAVGSGAARAGGAVASAAGSTGHAIASGAKKTAAAASGLLHHEH